MGQWNMRKTPEVGVWTGFTIHSASYLFSVIFYVPLELPCYLNESCPGTVPTIRRF